MVAVELRDELYEFTYEVFHGLFNYGVIDPRETDIDEISQSFPLVSVC